MRIDDILKYKQTKLNKKVKYKQGKKMNSTINSSGSTVLNVPLIIISVVFPFCALVILIAYLIFRYKTRFFQITLFFKTKYYEKDIKVNPKVIKFYLKIHNIIGASMLFFLFVIMILRVNLSYFFRDKDGSHLSFLLTYLVCIPFAVFLFITIPTLMFNMFLRKFYKDSCLMGDDLLYERLVNDDSQSEAYQINFDEKNILHFEWENNNKKGKIVLKKINRSSKYAKYWVYLSSIMNFNKLELKKNNNTYPITKYSFRNELNKYWNDVTSQEK